MSDKIRLGFAMCGSYCTFAKVFPAAEALAADYDMTGIMSENVYSTDTRFGDAKEHRERLERLTGKPIISTIKEAEPIGPKKLLDVLVVAPCTGNTLAKLAAGVADSSVTMACKAHLRNARPLVIAVSTNDALGTNARNIGELLNRKNVYFVPFGQDNPEKKALSMVADMTQISDTVQAALEGRQIQPILLR